MLIAALLVGALTAYYFGLRYGLWAAVATVGLLLVAAFLPGMIIPAYLALGAATILIQVIGSRRPRPPDAVLVVRWLRRRAGQLREVVSNKKERRR